MTHKKTFYTEAAYIAGLLILAFGTALMERADFGLSMVVAPAYLVHRKLSQTMPFFTFGMAEYVLQACLLVVLSLVMHRFKKGYLFSFVTAVLYGFSLDACMALVKLIPDGGSAERPVFFVVGLLLGALAISFFFHSYLPPEAYELFVKELAESRGWELGKVKTIYDITSCIVSVILSFLFFGFGHFEGVKGGTFIGALLNGWLIGKWGKVLDRYLEFKDGLPLREFFQS